jgi:hypothetical protein
MSIWDAAGQDDVVVDDERRRGHDTPRDDLAGVGDLVDLDAEAEIVERLAGVGLEVLAVHATGAEDLDVHDGVPFELDDRVSR